MTKKSLMLLFVCLVLGAGIAAYVWADCCSGDALCHGGVLAQLGGCVFVFEVDHNWVEEAHDVYLWIMKDGDPAFYPHLMEVRESPQPLCLLHTLPLELDANSTYIFYFTCADCSGKDPNVGTHNVMTGNCGG